MARSSSNQADDFFKSRGAVGNRSEITNRQVQRAAHFTYRDGFRLGVGIFVGLLLGTTLLLLVVWGLSKVFH